MNVNQLSNGGNQQLADPQVAVNALPKDAGPTERARLMIELMKSHPDPGAVLCELMRAITEGDQSTCKMKQMAAAFLATISEPALAEDWNRPEEDAAWSRLQPEK